MSLIADAKLSALLDALHAQSEGQEAAIGAYIGERAAAGDLSWEALDEAAHRFMADKLVALDRDKAEFCYGLCRATGARRIVEIGTSFGVSTLYLAAAARDNAAAAGGEGPAPLATGTEHEPDKAAAARANFRAAGLEALIDLKVGDLRETLKSLEGPIDFVLMDIWTEMARPAIELLAPHLREGAVIIADNTLSHREPYRAYFDFIADPSNRLRTTTLPFSGGLEMTVRLG